MKTALEANGIGKVIRIKEWTVDGSGLHIKLNVEFEDGNTKKTIVRGTKASGISKDIQVNDYVFVRGSLCLVKYKSPEGENVVYEQIKVSEIRLIKPCATIENKKEV